MNLSRIKRSLSSFLAVILILSFLPITVMAENDNKNDTIDLWMSLTPLKGLATVMQTASHPDDERNALLAYLHLEEGAGTVIATVTRGNGGQNAIGPETNLAYSTVRTIELEKAAEMIGSDLEILNLEYDSITQDFGFSKRWEETYEKWDIDLLKGRFIEQIRKHRPDVIIQSFNFVPTQHGHHQAVTRMTEEIFEMAGDPSVHPEHQYKAFQPKKLYDVANEENYDVAVDASGFNKVFGLSYEQLGQNSRYMHLSQSMGRDIAPGTQGIHRYYIQKTTLDKPEQKEKSFFEDIPLTFTDFADLYRAKDENVANIFYTLEEDVTKVLNAYPNNEKVLTNLAQMKKDVDKGLNIVKNSKLSEDEKYDLNFRLNKKIEQLSVASQKAAPLTIRVEPESYEVAVGDSVKVNVSVHNGGNTTISNIKPVLNTPSNWRVTDITEIPVTTLGYNKTATYTYYINIPIDGELFHPYFDTPMTSTVNFTTNGVESKVNAKPEKLFAVMPEYGITLTPENYVLNTENKDNKVPITIGVTSYVSGNTNATVGIDIPEGWTIEPATQNISFTGKNQVKTADFIIKPNSITEERFVLKAYANKDGVISNQTVQVVEYPHIGRTYYLYDSNIDVQGASVKIPDGLKVGYYNTCRDNIDDALVQIGVNVDTIDDNAILYSDLSVYDAIVLGIRAYRTGDSLITARTRLLEYVENGGHLIVQYHQNSAADRWDSSYAPYPLTIGTPTLKWRVVEEDAPVTILLPEHKVFNYPNIIKDNDWDGWYQERSIYNIMESAPEYEKLISSYDTGEEASPQDGMWITAPYGKGTYTYTSVVWYRQLETAMAPGAYRLFVNMLSQTK